MSQRVALLRRLHCLAGYLNQKTLFRAHTANNMDSPKLVVRGFGKHIGNLYIQHIATLNTNPKHKMSTRATTYERIAINVPHLRGAELYIQQTEQICNTQNIQKTQLICSFCHFTFISQLI